MGGGGGCLRVDPRPPLAISEYSYQSTQVYMQIREMSFNSWIERDLLPFFLILSVQCRRIHTKMKSIGLRFIMFNWPISIPVTGLMKNKQPDRGLNQGPFAYRMNALPIELSGPLTHNSPSTSTRSHVIVDKHKWVIFNLGWCEIILQRSYY